MSNIKTINPLKGIEQQVNKILFSNKKGVTKEIIKYNDVRKATLLDVKQQLIFLVKELKQKHLNLVA